ncbi:MAG: flagellar hook-basal body complex protein FliE [Pseudomonadota bacterium]
MADLGAGVSAAQAYLKAAQSAAAAPTNEAGDVAAFGQILDTAIAKTTEAGASAETAIAGAAMGQGDLVDVVTAVAAAEATLETVVAVRDQVIKAYQEILRMPI